METSHKIIMGIIISISSITILVAIFVIIKLTSDGISTNKIPNNSSSVIQKESEKEIKKNAEEAIAKAEQNKKEIMEFNKQFEDFVGRKKTGVETAKFLLQIKKSNDNEKEKATNRIIKIKVNQNLIQNIYDIKLNREGLYNVKVDYGEGGFINSAEITESDE